MKDYVVIFVAANPDAEKKWCDDNGKSVESAKKDEAFKKEIMESIYTLADANKFNTLEKPKQIFIMDAPFSVENDLLTPSFKTKRNVAAKVFEKDIEELYDAPPMDMKKK